MSLWTRDRSCWESKGGTWSHALLISHAHSC